MGRRFRTLSLDMELVAFDRHDKEPDQGIDFSRFAFMISISDVSRATWSEEVKDIARLTGLILASAITQEFACETMVLRNMQKLIRTFDAS